MLAAVLAWCLILSPVRVEASTPQVDPVATQNGLRLRMGDGADGWSIVVESVDENGEAAVALTSPGDQVLRRSVLLSGQNVEDRSRELASSLALVIEEYKEDKPPPKPPPEPPPKPPPKPSAPALAFGWLGLGARAGVGPPSAPDADLGVGLRGGLWLASDHVQPIVAFSWSRSIARPLVLDGLRFGAGAMFGGSVAKRRVWLGAGGLGRAMWTQAADRQRIATWTSSTELAVLAQFRARRWMVGLRVGADLTLPPIAASGDGSDLRWGPVRFLVGVDFGLLWSRRPRLGPTAGVGYTADERGGRTRVGRGWASGGRPTR